MMTKVLLLSESSFFRYCMSWGASGTKSWLMFVYCQPFSNILPAVLFQTLPVGRGSSGSNPRGTESTLSGTWLYIYQKCIVLQCTLKIYTTFFYLGVWDVLIGETNISHQRVCKLLCVLLHLCCLNLTAIDMAVTRVHIIVCTAGSSTGLQGVKPQWWTKRWD